MYTSIKHFKQIPYDVDVSDKQENKGFHFNYLSTDLPVNIIIPYFKITRQIQLQCPKSETFFDTIF
jgi:hypothetical protein